MDLIYNVIGICFQAWENKKSAPNMTQRHGNMVFINTMSRFTASMQTRLLPWRNDAIRHMKPFVSA